MAQIADLIREIVKFRDARDWKQFHLPNHLASAISIEAAELQEHFLWKSPTEVQSLVAQPQKRAAIAEEVADILIFTLLLAHELGINPDEAIQGKLKKNAANYPIDKARGSSTKYTEL
jgi:NTP pyrophosphatase (non-canonical NTP hydrolase)